MPDLTRDQRALLHAIARARVHRTPAGAIIRTTARKKGTRPPPTRCDQAVRTLGPLVAIPTGAGPVTLTEAGWRQLYTTTRPAPPTPTGQPNQPQPA